MNETLRTAAISPLRQRMIDDMNVRRFSRETQRNYVRDVGRFATFLGRSPDTATPDDVRQFQIDQREAGVSTPTMNSIVSALRFFFTQTIDRPDLARKLVRAAHPRNLPVVLSRDEVVRLLNATTTVKYQAALSVAYGAGRAWRRSQPSRSPMSTASACCCGSSVARAAATVTPCSQPIC
jgi:site-specific recombinase XerD